MRRAVTLVEVLLAIAIVAMTVVPLLGLFSAASDSAHLSSDHTLTLALSSKVAEELRAASWENRHHIEMLTHDTASGGVKPVVDDGTPYFSGIEDTAPPAGRIRAGEDAGIVPAMGPLHRELKNHRMLIDGSATATPTGDALFDVSIMFDWSDPRERGRRTSFAVLLPRVDTAVLTPPSDRAAADKLIAQALYGSDDPLAQIASTRGGDLEVLRALGDVALISHTLETSEPEHQQDLAELEQEARSAPEDLVRAKALTRLARALENRACLRLRAATYLGPALELLATRFRPAALGNPPPPPLAYREAVRLIAYLPLDLDWDLSDAILTCHRAVGLPAAAMPARIRNRLLERAAALAALMALTIGPPDPALARTILEEMVAFNEGRNPNVAAQAQIDLLRCRDADTLRNSYQPSTRIADWNRFTGNVITAVSAVLSEGQPPPSDPGGPPPPAPPPGSRTLIPTSEDGARP